MIQTPKTLAQAMDELDGPAKATLMRAIAHARPAANRKLRDATIERISLSVPDMGRSAGEEVRFNEPEAFNGAEHTRVERLTVVVKHRDSEVTKLGTDCAIVAAEGAFVEDAVVVRTRGAEIDANALATMLHEAFRTIYVNRASDTSVWAEDDHWILAEVAAARALARSAADGDRAAVAIVARHQLAAQCTTQGARFRVLVDCNGATVEAVA